MRGRSLYLIGLAILPGSAAGDGSARVPNEVAGIDGPSSLYASKDIASRQPDERR